MGLDGPDEDDAPTTARRDSPPAECDLVSVDGDLGGDSDEARTAYNIEYRALVDAEYAAATDFWTGAVPALRRTWEEHEKKYPYPERSRPTVDQDGSWHSEGGLELDPLHNAEASRACAQVREQARDDILPAMRRVEDADSDRHLAGLEHWLKGEDRLKEKIANYMRAPNLTVSQGLTLDLEGTAFSGCLMRRG